MTERIWEQQPGESDKAYNAFTMYYEMGFKRSFPKVAAALGSRSSNYIGEWAKKYQWKERVRSWDNEKLRETEEIRKEAIRTTTETQLQQIKGLRSIMSLPFKVLSKRLKETDGKVQAFEDLDKLSTTELYDLVLTSGKALESTIKVERLLLGVPTEISKSETTISGESEITIYGDKIATDENATKLLTQLLNTVAGSQNGKPSHNGTLHNGRKLQVG